MVVTPEVVSVVAGTGQDTQPAWTRASVAVPGHAPGSSVIVVWVQSSVRIAVVVRSGQVRSGVARPGHRLWWLRPGQLGGGCPGSTGSRCHK